MYTLDEKYKGSDITWQFKYLKPIKYTLLSLLFKWLQNNQSQKHISNCDVNEIRDQQNDGDEGDH